jgi:pimeloyl-ACP methyl ester carboxylesterase
MYTDKVRMRDLVVLLPGITGSTLQKDGRDIWALSLRAIFGAVASRGNSLQQLKLGRDDASVDDLEDGIVANKLIPEARLVPGLVKIDGYTQLSRMIRENFDVRDGSIDLAVNPYPPGNYFEFPYDWRRDNRVAARRLEKLVRCRLKQWRAYAGDDARVILLAHSMGGIVARYFLEVLDGWKDCRALITFGTPFRGSVKALNCLANGCAKGFFDLTDVVRSFTSVYQLLPDYRVVKVGDQWCHVSSLTHEAIDQERAQQAALFHKDIRDHVEARRTSGNEFPYLLLPVVGTYQPTLQSAEMAGQDLTVSNILPPKVDELAGHGDGTVPYLSAIPPELLRMHRNTFFAECHASIHCNDQSLDFIYSQLQDLQMHGLEDVQGGDLLTRRRTAAISLSAPELCLHGDPITIRARVLINGEALEDPQQFQNHFGSLKALITGVDTQVTRELVFQQHGTEAFAETEALSPGLYKLEVGPSMMGPMSPRPVHDFFQVAVGP